MGDAFIYKHGSARMERGTILICIFSIFSIFVQDVPSDELVVQDVPGTEENSDEIVVQDVPGTEENSDEIVVQDVPGAEENSDEIVVQDFPGTEGKEVRYVQDVPGAEENSDEIVVQDVSGTEEHGRRTWHTALSQWGRPSLPSLLTKKKNKIGDKATIRHLQKESIKLQAAFIAVAAGAA